MSSTAFAAPPALELAPSPAFALLLAVAHLVAGVVAFTLPVPLFVPLSILVALIASATHVLRMHALLTDRAAIVRVLWRGDGLWSLVLRDGTSHDAELQPGSYVHPALLVLNFKLVNGGRRSVVIFVGRADADAIRRWRAALAAQRSAAE